MQNEANTELIYSKYQTGLFMPQELVGGTGEWAWARVVLEERSRNEGNIS